MLSSIKARRLILPILAAVSVVGLLVPHCRALTYTGVSLAGADFGESVLPGTYNSNYTYPTTAEVDYFLGKGMNTFRIPFRWERLQQSAGGAFNSAELARLNNIVNYATSHGAQRLRIARPELRHCELVLYAQHRGCQRVVAC